MARRPLKPRKIAQVKRKPKKRTKSSLRKMRLELEAKQKAKVIELYGNDCYTCPAKNLQGSNCQLGHVPWPRSILSTACKYDVRFTRIQCFRCNIHHGGMGAKALERMIQEGIPVAEMWAENVATKGRSYGPKWFQQQLSN